ncbi:chymotrypsinogen A-like isoform X1 [Anticarsia gemmatalis]|uniref:chymotrypsinogen A-like isoform X1 n=1 Tax=Anticarsia gemmatalis TaxID=129554 RepID=UPI003F764570
MVRSFQCACMFQSSPFTGKYGTEIRLGDLPHHVLIFRLFDKKERMYRAFCAGSVIGEKKVLSSAHCFLSNRKVLLHDLKTVRVVGGIVQTMIVKTRIVEPQQWRTIKKIQSQRFFRFPAYNLGVLIMNEPWQFNQYVNKIPYESKDHDFDGVCISTAVKATKSWSLIKYVYTEEVQMIKKRTCEGILQRSCRHYFCTEFDNRNKYAYSETEGGGLVCRETGDPNEIDPKQGILVGITSVINIGIPNLHVRVGNHAKWIEDGSWELKYNQHLIVLCVLFTLLNVFL